MAGHSKWANIQHRKGAQDARRGKLFTKLIREITVSARQGGPEAVNNPRLRAAVDKALTANMSKDTIDRAIKKGAGAGEGDNFEEVRYEGYGPGGVAVMVDCLTDNRNRTVAEVRHAFSKHGGNLGTDGSVGYLFSKVGILNFEPGTPEESILDIALEAGADDVVSEKGGSIEVRTSPDIHADVVVAMEARGFEPANAEITMRASVEVELDVETGQKLLRLLDHLEDLDDAQAVYSNADIPDEAYAD
jgi:YebC/PmpR family DNA-binding regulatory protein